MSTEDRQKNFALLRERLLETRGKEYWRNLEELADSDEFRELVAREYPQAAEEWDDSVNRRTFVKLMGASLALAGLSACAYQPTETIVPFVRDPEGYTPGKPAFYATAMSLGGAATGLLVRSNEGRPTKIEGNELHPASLGASDAYSQASLLDLYDPDRSQTLNFRGEIRTWSAFLGAVSQALDNQRPKQGAGLRFLTETITSPTLAAQIADILREFPQARWYQYEPVGRGNSGTGAFQAFGQPVNVIYNFERADRILGLDADFLACGPASLRYARQFAARRRVEGGTDRMSRFYAVETTPSNTGASADHRWPLRPSEIEGFARAIASRLGVSMAGTAPAPASIAANIIDAIARDLQQAGSAAVVVAGDEQPAVIHALAHAMNQRLGSIGNAVVYTDPLEFRPPGQETTALDSIAELRTLVQEMNAGQVDMLVMVGGNPIYNAPADLQFRASMEKVGLRIHLSLYEDETSALCHWHIPESHYLESWGDARAFDGTVSIVQPLIAPLYRGTKSPIEFLAAFTQQPERTGYEIVRAFWQGKIGAGGAALARNTAQGTGQRAASAQQPPTANPSTATAQNTGQGAASNNQTTNGAASGNQATANQPAANQATTNQGAAAPQSSNTSQSGAAGAAPGASSSATQGGAPAAAGAGDFEQQWRRALHDGVIQNTSLPTRTVTLAANWDNQLPAPAPDPNAFEIVFRADPTVYDGRFANNGWLQELPKPITKITWDNAAILSPATAQKLGLEKELGWKGGEWHTSLVNLSFQGRTVAAPVWILPGQPDNTVTVHLGYGRWRAGRSGTGTEEKPVGFNAYAIRPSGALWSGTGLQVAKTGGTYQIATTQLHHLMENRDLVRAGSVEDYKKNPSFAPEEKHEPGKDMTMYPNYDYSKEYAWGMAIDVSACIGCNACVVACQSENNIPVVGKEQVLRSREMHWLRVDSYYKGEEANPRTFFQPVPCMHCELAPCEPVCPVAATVHSAEGLNDMVYNRCVGTRYCSNNCPYKVRRFNFLLYQDFETPTYKLMRNPEVTVRSRGVMEKCTYCVQRIQYAKIESEKEDRPVRDGEIVTACQGACPSEAIVFGNINDPNSRVAKLKAQERNYGLLADLNTRPRTTYLAAIRNLNPEIGPATLMGKTEGEH